MIAVLREIIAPVLVGILVGIITSIITNIKYKNEKTWELKVSNYQMLIEGLAKLKYLVRTELESTDQTILGLLIIRPFKRYGNLYTFESGLLRFLLGHIP